MSKADDIFKKMCEEVLNNGCTIDDGSIRAHWEDGTPAKTIQSFGIVNTYDLQEEFPAITYRRTAIKSAFKEILWIYQMHSNNIHDLENLHIWDSWADPCTGSIGKAYGYQVNTLSPVFKSGYDIKDKNGNLITTCDKALLSFATADKSIEEKLHSVLHISKKEYPSVKDRIETTPRWSYIVYMNQIDKVIYQLRENPSSRRIMISLWNVSELEYMNLEPCCWSCNFNVSKDKEGNNVLNMILNQRSSDILAANNWNVVQYALLLMAIAQVCNMKYGKLIHVITNAHIYDRHIEDVKKMLKRETYPAPKVSLNKKIKNFYDFTVDDVKIEEYKHGDQIKFPIAI